MEIWSLIKPLRVNSSKLKLFSVFQNIPYVAGGGREFVFKKATEMCSSFEIRADEPKTLGCILFWSQIDFFRCKGLAANGFSEIQRTSDVQSRISPISRTYSAW